MSENKQTLPPSLTLHALSTDDARIIDVLLGKSSIRPFRNGDGIGHVVVIEMRDGERWELPLGDIGRIALARRGGNASAAVFGMVDPKDLNPNDARAAWSQFALIEGPTTEPNPSIMDGGGFMFVPFFAEENDGRKLRDRLHVVLESPFRPMDGLRPTLDLPRAFVKETSLAKVAQELHKSACDVLKDIGGIDSNLCDKRLMPLGPFNPWNSYSDRAKLPKGAGVKAVGFRFHHREVEKDSTTGLYRLGDEVIHREDEEEEAQTDRSGWGNWRFYPYEYASTSESGLTLSTLFKLFNVLDKLDY